MEALRDVFKLDSLHHAYLLTGKRGTLLESLVASLESLTGWSVTGNPDALILSTPTLYIETARELISRAQKRPVGERKLFVLSFLSATSEAQNALLKLLEEPPAHTHFFLITTSPETLMPTLRSRLYELAPPAHTRTKSKEARTFLEGNGEARLAMLEDIIADKDKEAATALLEEIEDEVYQQFRAGKGAELARALADIERVRRYVQDRSAPLKQLLEYTAAALPQLKL